jgi:hypothetical protein
MPTKSGGFLRDNLFLVAAGALPLVVVLFFVASTVVPAWLVDPPAYDLVLTVTGPYDRNAPDVAVTFEVRDGQVVAVSRPAKPNSYPQPVALFVLDHASLSLREIPVPRPDFEPLVEGAPAPVERTVVMDLAARRATAGAVAPDGYALGASSRGSTGLIGEVFGMRRSRYSPRLVKDSRVVAFDLPSGYASDVAVVAWLDAEGSR